MKGVSTKNFYKSFSFGSRQVGMFQVLRARFSVQDEV